MFNTNKKNNDTIYHKTFGGGNLTFVGANSPASLASRPKRIIIGDEIDRFPNSAGEEGDPCKLAEKRSTTFWNKKVIWTSTPTIKGASKIEEFFENSDKRKYFIKCPDCYMEQILEFKNLIWEKISLKLLNIDVANVNTK